MTSPNLPKTNWRCHESWLRNIKSLFFVAKACGTNAGFSWTQMKIEKKAEKRPTFMFSWFGTIGKFCILWSQQNVEDEHLKVSTNRLVKQMSKLCKIGWSIFYLLVFNWVVDRGIQKKNFLFCLIYLDTKNSITLT